MRRAPVAAVVELAAVRLAAELRSLVELVDSIVVILIVWEEE